MFLNVQTWLAASRPYGKEGANLQRSQSLLLLFGFWDAAFAYSVDQSPLAIGKSTRLELQLVNYSSALQFAIAVGK